MSPFRALAVAHVRSTWNRLRKQSSLPALWAFFLVLGFLFLTLVLPFLSALGLLGWAAGRALSQPEADLAVIFGAVTFTALTALSGFVGGISTGSRQLPWETLRGFPVRSFTLFAAECFAGAFEAITLIEISALLVLSVGACVGAPRGTPIFLMLFVTHVVFMLAAQQFFGSVAQRASRQLRTMLVFLPLAAIMTSTVVPMAIAQLKAGEALTWAERLSRVAPYLPAEWSLRAVQGLEAGEPDVGLIAQAVLVPLLLAALSVLVAWQFVAREKPLVQDTDDRKPARLWSFTSQTLGMARLQWESLARSLPGRFGLVMPLMTLVLIRGPLAAFRASELHDALPGAGWTAPIAFGYASLASTNLLFNQFGLDRHGVKVLFLLPVEPLAMLRGKLLGFAAWQSVQALLLLGLLALTGKGEPGEYLIGLLLYACVFLILAMVGQFASIWQPRPLRKNGLRAAQPPLAIVLIMFGTLATAGALLYGVVFVMKHYAPGWEVPVLLGVGLFLFALAFPVSHFNALFLERNRERLVETLGSAG